MRKAIAVASLISVVATGCLSSNPATGTAPTGDPLLVMVERGTGSYTTNEVVKKETVRNNDGHIVGTIEQRADVEHSFRWSQTSFFQGTDKLDEQDFYRLAGDRDSERDVISHRRSASKIQKVGLALTLISIVAGGAMIAVGATSDNTTLMRAAVLPIAIGLPIGGVAIVRGKRKMRRLALPNKRAVDAADYVRFCDEGDCREGAGFHKYADSRPTSMKMRDEAPADTTSPEPGAEPSTGGAAASATSLFGEWRGKLKTDMQVDGKVSSRTTTGKISVTDVGNGEIEVNLDPSNEECKVRGKLQDNGARLQRSSCTTKQGGGEAQVQFLNGSIELRDGGLVIEVNASIDVTARGKSEHAGVTWTGTLTR